MFLEQIERKQKDLMDKQHDDIPRAKTIGIKVKPDLYALLATLKKERGLKSMKEAVLLASEVGVKVLLDK